MDGEFPGVVDLNVGGTHYRTLLSTLTKDEDSKLAAMFTGQLPVYKDKDGRYFIEADGFSFRGILQYLIYDELPFQDTNYGGGFGGGGTGFGGGGVGFGGGGGGLFGGHRHSLDARYIENLYKDALNLGLTKLARHLEEFQPNFVNIKMDEYRNSIRGYESCLTEVLNMIPAECLFHKTEFTLRINRDLQQIDEEKCCDHECRMMPWNSFGQHFYSSIDAMVKVRFEMNPTVLSALVIDLEKRGYNVQGRITVCDCNCKKEVKQSKYIVFASQTRKCCGEELFLLTFRWDVVTHPGIFGTKNAFGQKQTTGGLFGGQQNSGFSFGSPQQKQAGSGCFGGGQQQDYAQAQGFGFGSAQQGSPGGQGNGFSFGSSQQGNVGQTGTSAFGSSQGTFGQGSVSGFGTVQQGAFEQNQGSVFGSPPAKGSSFSFGGQQQQQQPQQQTLFGKQSQQKPFSFGQTNTQQQGTGLFGSSTVPKSSKQLFGSPSPKPFAGTKNVTAGSTKAGAQTPSGTSFGGGFSFGGAPKQPTAFAGKGSPAPSGLFGVAQNKSQHTFGGLAAFENKFGGLNLQQTTEKSDQGSIGFTSSADDSGSNLFGKPSAADDNDTPHGLDKEHEQL